MEKWLLREYFAKETILCRKKRSINYIRTYTLIYFHLQNILVLQHITLLRMEPRRGAVQEVDDIGEPCQAYLLSNWTLNCQTCGSNMKKIWVICSQEVCGCHTIRSWYRLALMILTIRLRYFNIWLHDWSSTEVT